MDLESSILNSGFKVAAVSCILIHQDELLLIKRNKEPHKNLYCPVGGKVDPFESPRQTVIREVDEETGLEINNLQFSGIMVESSPLKYNWISLIFSSEIEHYDPPKSDEGTLEWVHSDQLNKIPIPETDIHIYYKILAGDFFYFDVIYDENLKIISMSNEMIFKC